MDFVQHASEYTLFSTGVGEAEGEGDCFASCSLFRYNLHRDSRHSFRGFDILETLAISLFCLVRGCETCSKRSQLQHWFAGSPGRLVVALAKGIEGLR